MIKALNKFIEWITAIGMGALVIACVWQVVSRYIVGKPSTITEEFMRYGLIWITMLASPYAYGKGKQLMITFAVKRGSERFQAIIGVLVGVITAVFSGGVLIIGGTRVANNAVGQVSSSMQMPMQFLYYSLVLSGILMLLYAIIGIKDDIMKLQHGGAKIEKDYMKLKKV
ncbi:MULTISPECIES: TRAP transporter small permease [Clostridium]|uniref:Tripartite ATP-independent periplasmic transporter, DctQ component n=2 Tax=Clostridium TaxID=1485 RepID=A0A151ALC2_9CLOT|nr:MULTISPECIES: TRAP transporter small permease [Clostridium]KYH28441.1 tripartite ATP-independent periplasmic transporter, DctQ component [Clostridium colicanis DSM 13634]PRR75711.1 Tripartite ATP-independent periplasmic transporter, DctQ component [Clostridium thermopalmarium DSM 5974]PVZ26602.1 TRAP-type C4-dicarboxylate transport system permease small subunit [Clostridium thermopalmarium DSM 5974]